MARDISYKLPSSRADLWDYARILLLLHRRGWDSSSGGSSLKEQEFKRARKKIDYNFD